MGVSNWNQLTGANKPSLLSNMDWGAKFSKTPIVNNGMTLLPQGGAEAAIGGAPLQDIQVPTSMTGSTPTYSLGFGFDKAGGLPAAEGGWFDMKGKGGMALGAAQVGLGVYNAFEQSKQNDFMRGYYTNQMALQKQDFANAAKTTNNELAAREGRRLDASQGLAYDSTGNQAGRDAYMKNWGVKETF